MVFARLRACVLGVCVMLCLGSPPTSAQEKPDRQGVTVQVLSFNIRYGTARDGQNAWPHRRQLVIQTLKQRPWDFIGLQEALRFQLDELEEALPQLAELGVGRQDGRTAGEYSAILYQHRRWGVDRAGTFWLSDTPEKIASATWGNRIPRIVTWARFVHKLSGRPVWVFNTHFDHQSQPSREKSARLLASRIAAWTAGEPVIVTGDFNAGEENPAIVYLTRSKEGPVRLQDTFRLAHPQAEQVGTFNAFRGRRDGQKIDYVFIRGPWQVRWAAILNQYPGPVYPSDHWAVGAELLLER